jgi:competence protein ComEC
LAGVGDAIPNPTLALMAAVADPPLLTQGQKISTPAAGWLLPFAAALGWLGGTAIQLQQAVLLEPALRGGLALAALALLCAWGVLIRGRRTAPPDNGRDHPAAATNVMTPAGSSRIVARSMAGGGAAVMARLVAFSREPIRVAAILGFALAALAWAVVDQRAAGRLADALPPALEGQDLVIVGHVSGLPRHGLTGTRFTFVVESAHHAGEPVRMPRRVVLGWHRGFDPDAWLAAPQEALAPGDRWRFTVRLRQPHGAMNPHGFDLELWLFERGLRASGYVRALRDGRGAERLPDRAVAPVHALRDRLRGAIFERIDDPRAAGVLAALVVGDQSSIDAEGWELFRRTGTSHLMVISGMHVALFAGLAGSFVALVWRRHPRLALGWATPSAARWGGLLAATGYALLSGWGIPAQRTVCMLAGVVLIRSAGLRWPLPLVLLVVAAGVVAVDPWALGQPGFWLSFVAVALLLSVEPGDAAGTARPDPATAAGWLHRGWGAARSVLVAARQLLRVQAVATVGLAPLSLLFFQQVSVIGFVANLIAIPVVTLAAVPLALAGVLMPALWTPAAWAVQGLMGVLEALSAMPGAVWTAPAASGPAVACGLVGGVLMVLPLPLRLRLAGLALLLPLVAPVPDRPAHGHYEVVAVDVGQGNAVLVRTRGHLLVYDTGPRWSPEAEAGSRILLPLLRARGERRIDTLMLSHRDLDHTGGAQALLDAFPVGALESSLEPGHRLLATAVPQRRCEAGQRWHWDGVDFEVLHPTAEDYTRPGPANGLSCVLRVHGPQGALLLTGDIEVAHERALVAREGAALRSEVMLVPHHGSNTSSTPLLLDTVQPEVALVQAAYRSRYGHPTPAVVARYERRGIEVVRSDRCGAWSWRGDGSGRCEREHRRRYWHHRGD